MVVSIIVRIFGQVKQIIYKMQIKADIIATAQKGAEARLKSLVSITAPEIMIDRQRERLEMFLRGEIEIQDKDFLLGLPFTDRQVKTGNGGKKYISYQTANGIVNYFPNARFGAFISKAKS